MKAPQNDEQKRAIPGSVLIFPVLYLSLSRIRSNAATRTQSRSSRRAQKVILKCIARKPDRRYPFKSVLVCDLQNALYL